MGKGIQKFHRERMNSMYRKFVDKLNKFNVGFLKVEKWVCDIMFLFLISCLIAQVFYRFILKTPAPWTEELARYSFIFAMYLACGYTLCYGKHVDMNLLDTFLVKTKNPKKAFYIMSKVTNTANIVFCAYFISIYAPYLDKLRLNGRTAVSVDLPMWIVQSSVLIGFALMCWHSFVLLLQPYDGDAAAAETK